jgi:hypothetical protein
MSSTFLKISRQRHSALLYNTLISCQKALFQRYEKDELPAKNKSFSIEKTTTDFCVTLQCREK